MDKSSSPKFHAHTHTNTPSLGLSSRLPSTGNYFRPHTVTRNCYPWGWHIHTHSSTHTRTRLTCWLLILGFWLCSFGSNPGPDPLLHSGNPPKCTLMAAWSLVPRLTMLVRLIKTCAHTLMNTQTHWFTGIKVLVPQIYTNEVAMHAYAHRSVNSLADKRHTQGGREPPTALKTIRVKANSVCGLRGVGIKATVFGS